MSAVPRSALLRGANLPLGCHHESMRPSLVLFVKAWVRAVIELRRRKRAGLPAVPITVAFRANREGSR